VSREGQRRPGERVPEDGPVQRQAVAAGKRSLTGGLSPARPPGASGDRGDAPGGEPAAGSAPGSGWFLGSFIPPAAELRSAHGLDPEPNTGAVQRKESGAAGDDQVHEAAQSGVAGGGGPLPHLEAIQRSFGDHDVRRVQAHADGAAGHAAAAMGASAYATGDQVAFRGTPDLHTAAHEAAHVVQQRAGVQLQGGVGRPGDEHERNADAVADRVVSGQSAADLLPHAGQGGTGSAAAQKQIQKRPGDEEKGAPAHEKSLDDAMNEAAADTLPGAPKLIAFLRAIAAGDRAAALGAYCDVPAKALQVLDSPGVLRRLKGYPATLGDHPVESVLEVLGPDAILVLAEGAIRLRKPRWGEIILQAAGSAALWVAMLRSNPLWLFDFVHAATPTSATVTQEQARQMSMFADAMTGAYPKTLFERIYPPLVDATYDASRLKTRPWGDADVKRLFKGLAEHLPPAHVHTIVKGFYLGTHVMNEKGAFEPLGYGWYTSDGRVVMPAAPGYSGVDTDHNAVGGKKAAGSALGGKKLGHYDSTLLHEVGHGVGAASAGNQWATEWGEWKQLDIEAWSRQLFDDTAALGIASELELGHGVPRKDILPPGDARRWMAQKIAGREPGRIFTGQPATIGGFKVWTDRDVWTFISTHYGAERLTKYFLRWEKDGKPMNAYKVDADNQGADGRYYAYLTRWGDSHASYASKLYGSRVSPYSLSSPYEWFAEQYTEYYRSSKTGETLPADVKSKLLELDAVKDDDLTEKRSAPGRGDDAMLAEQTHEEKNPSFERMFAWWTEA
jgi:hypothetical protein